MPHSRNRRITFFIAWFRSIGNAEYLRSEIDLTGKRFTVQYEMPSQPAVEQQRAVQPTEEVKRMILFLNGSPRKAGVTSSLLRVIADEARSAGAEVEWVDVNNLSIRPCIGCLKCRPDKKCILPKDDGHRIGELIERCLLGEHARAVEDSVRPKCSCS